ncbi:MAG: hypothetical protein FJ044_02750 [Candidatus Cloacimonetes bacterium]|nr:hypothetical protein [Candidatus Cloacimonadota bacterium]
MKRFLVPIIVFAAVSWVICFALLNYSSPFVSTTSNSAYAGRQSLITNNKNVVLFLVTLFSVILFSLALILYFFYRLIGGPPGADKSSPKDGRKTIRRSLRQSFFAALGVITLAVLQLSKTLNPLTFILTIAIVIALERNSSNL